MNQKSSESEKYLWVTLDSEIDLDFWENNTG